MPRVILILGGTTEARTLAGALAGTGHTVINSLAGRTGNPLRPAGEVRIGGFGGAAGLADFLRARRVDVLVDATHPFAAGISTNAAEAAASAGVPLLVLRRPGWVARSGDDWHRVRSVPEAAALVPRLGHRVFLTTGRQSLAAFAGVDDCWFLARSVEPPEPPMPARLQVILARGPFTAAAERELMLHHRIDVLVSKDSGGPPAKLDAARELRIPVILVDRPPAPPAATTVTTVDEAITRLPG